MAVINNPLSALKHKNFRYFWLGMCVSLVGSWMQNIAQPWLAYTLTESPLLLSLVGALQFAPVFMFSIFAGVIVDRIPKKKLLLITQTSAAVITMIIAILIWTEAIRYWQLLIFAFLLGIVNALDMPARQAFVVELVNKKYLMNAIALNSTAFNSARIIGPALAGIFIGYYGIAVCFFINSLSFIAVIFSLIKINPRKIPKINKIKKSILSEVKDGLKYIYNNKLLFNTMFFVAIIGTFTPNFGVLVPVFTKEILHQKEEVFGFLMSFLGVGALSGAIFIAAISKNGPFNVIMKVVPLIIGLLMAGIGFMNGFVSAGILIVGVGFFFAIFSANANSTLQIATINEYRGRVMSVYTLVFTGTLPIGHLFAGAFADRLGPQIGFMACGGAILLLLIPLYIYNFRNKDKIY